MLPDGLPYRFNEFGFLTASSLKVDWISNASCSRRSSASGTPSSSCTARLASLTDFAKARRACSLSSGVFHEPFTLAIRCRKSNLIVSTRASSAAGLMVFCYSIACAPSLLVSSIRWQAAPRGASLSLACAPRGTQRLPANGVCSRSPIPAPCTFSDLFSKAIHLFFNCPERWLWRLRCRRRLRCQLRLGCWWGAQHLLPEFIVIVPTPRHALTLLPWNLAGWFRG